MSPHRIRRLLPPAARRFAPLGVIAVAAVSAVLVFAVGSSGSTPKVIGSPLLGRVIFLSSGCGGCHVLKASHSKGTVGPNLDGITLTEAQIVNQITNGGSKYLTPAQKKLYRFPMTAYKSRLSKTQIQNLAAWVFTKRNPAAVPPPATTTTATTTTTPGGVTTTPTTTTTKTGGGGGGTVNPCPPGQTIQTGGNTDADGDELGTEPDDNDGCV